MELKDLVDRIRHEADRIRSKDGLSIDAAYERAVAAVIRTTAEKQVITPLEARIVAEVRNASRGGRPVSLGALMIRLQSESRYSLYYHLQKLERRGLVYRPGGAKSKGGWMAD